MTDAPSSSRPRTINLPTRPLIEQDLISEGSPRTTVAGQLQGLDLDSHSDLLHLNSSTAIRYHMGANDSIGSGGFNPHIRLPGQTYDAPVTPPHSSHGPLSDVKSDSNLQLEIPETPRLRPVYSPTPPPSNKRLTGSRSPPLSSPATALWWNDNEITGHDPKDPSDDGYGINGVGFLPTPAIATARAERRKKQVAEWKSREAREARQKRSDRRRRREAESGRVGNPIVRDESGGSSEEGRRVRFLEA